MDILGKRSDGYHDVEMILQSIALADTIELSKIDRNVKLEIISEITGAETLPLDENNLIVKAAKLMIKTYKINSGVFIRLTKKIPIAAGLAGGSTDAAAVIRGMNELFNLHLTTDELCEVAAQIGSDVPFCVVGGTCLAYGRGEKLKRLSDLQNIPIVLVKPRGAIPTAWAYKTYDSDKSDEHPNNSEICEAINISDYEAVAELMFNVLERVAIKKYSAINTIKEKLFESGAIGAMMSGSGPTVFGIAKTQNEAKKIADSFKDSGYQIFVTETVGRVRN